MDRDNPETNPITQDCKPDGRAVLLGSLTLLLSTWVPLPNKVSCSVSTCVSLDNLFLNVRQEPIPRPWKEPPCPCNNLATQESCVALSKLLPFRGLSCLLCKTETMIMIIIFAPYSILAVSKGFLGIISANPYNTKTVGVARGHQRADTQKP